MCYFIDKVLYLYSTWFIKDFNEVFDKPSTVMIKSITKDIISNSTGGLSILVVAICVLVIPEMSLYPWLLITADGIGIALSLVSILFFRRRSGNTAVHVITICALIAACIQIYVTLQQPPQ